jgi:hypothetical protein
MDEPDGDRETVDYSRRYWRVCTALEFAKLGLWIIWLVYGTRR